MVSDHQAKSSTRLQALIVDDEPLARHAIRVRLEKDPEIDTVWEAETGRQAIRKIQAQNPHLVFLDVRMPDVDGFTVAESIRVPVQPLLIFVTAFEQYALRAFQTHAFDYLMKPFTDQSFQEVLVRAKSQLLLRHQGELLSKLRNLVGDGNSPHYPEKIVVRANGRISLINTMDIKWIQADGNYLKITSERDSYNLRETMMSIEQRLDPRRFVRIHRSTIVNIAQIHEIRPWHTGEYIVTMKDGLEMTLSRGYRDHLAKLIAQYS